MSNPFSKIPIAMLASILLASSMAFLAHADEPPGDSDGDGFDDDADFFDAGDGSVRVYVSKIIGNSSVDYNESQSEPDDNDGREAPDFTYWLNVDWDCDDTDDDSFNMLDEDDYWPNTWVVDDWMSRHNEPNRSILEANIPDDSTHICIWTGVYDYEPEMDGYEMIDVDESSEYADVVASLEISSIENQPLSEAIWENTGDGQATSFSESVLPTATIEWSVQVFAAMPDPPPEGGTSMPDPPPEGGTSPSTTIVLVALVAVSALVLGLVTIRTIREVSPPKQEGSGTLIINEIGHEIENTLLSIKAHNDALSIFDPRYDQMWRQSEFWAGIVAIRTSLEKMLQHRLDIIQPGNQYRDLKNKTDGIRKHDKSVTPQIRTKLSAAHFIWDHETESSKERYVVALRDDYLEILEWHVSNPPERMGE